MVRGLLALLVAAASIPAVARAELAQVDFPESRFMVRVRPVFISPANESDAIPALGVPADAIHVSDKAIPEIDFTYFFNKYFSTELILTIPQEHDVTLSGADIGTFRHLPPVLTVQAGYPYKFVRPYVGAGVNLTLITSEKLAVPGVGELDLEDRSFGFAAQAGIDFRIARNWSLNLDAKYVQIAVDVKAGGEKVSEVRVNPWLLGGGLAYQF